MERHPFYNWLRDTGRRHLWLVSCGAALQVLLGLVKLLADPKLKETVHIDVGNFATLVPSILAALHAIVLILVFIFGFSEPRLDRQRHGTASTAVLQFHHWWAFNWLCWIGFYGILTARNLAEYNGKEAEATIPVLQVFLD